MGLGWAKGPRSCLDTGGARCFKRRVVVTLLIAVSLLKAAPHEVEMLDRETHTGVTNWKTKKLARSLLQLKAVPTASQESQLLFLSSVRAGDIGRVEQFLQKNPPVGLIEASSPKGTPAIWSAAYNGHVEISRLLADSGANVNSLNANSTTPAYAAAQRGHLEVLKLLAQQGADLNLKSLWGSTPLMVASQYGQADVVNWLIQRAVDLDAQTFASKQTALWSASFKGHHEIVKSLLDAGAAVELGDVQKSTPLFAASQEGHQETVRILLNNGANPNARDSTDNTPLHAATAMCRVGIIKMLLKHGANISIADAAGRNAGDGNIVCFHRQQADSVAVDIQLLTNPIMVAVQGGDIDAVKEALDSEEEAVFVKLRNGWTGLHLAAARGDPDTVGEFVARGAQKHAVDIVGLKPSDVIGSLAKVDDEIREEIATMLSDSTVPRKAALGTSPTKRSKFPVVPFLLVSIGLPLVCCVLAVLAIWQRRKTQDLANISQRINTWLITESPNGAAAGQGGCQPLGGTQNIFYNSGDYAGYVQVEKKSQRVDDCEEALLHRSALLDQTDSKVVYKFEKHNASSSSPSRHAASLSTNPSVGIKTGGDDMVVREPGLDGSRQSSGGALQQEEGGKRVSSLDSVGLSDVAPLDEEGFHKPKPSLSFSGVPSHEFLPPPELFILESEGLLPTHTVGLKALTRRHQAKNTAYTTFSSTWTSESSGKGLSPGPSGSIYQDHETDAGGVPVGHGIHEDKFWELNRMVRSGGAESGQYSTLFLDVSDSLELQNHTFKDQARMHSHSSTELDRAGAEVEWMPARRTLSENDPGTSWVEETMKDNSAVHKHWEVQEACQLDYSHIFWTTESVEDMMERVWTGEAQTSTCSRRAPSGPS